MAQAASGFLESHGGQSPGLSPDVVDSLVPFETEYN